MKKMKNIVLVFLLTTFMIAGCRPKPFTNITPLTDFLVLDNGNVEIVWVENGRYRTTIIEPTCFYALEQDGESRIIETLIDGYFQIFVYLDDEDYERFLNETNSEEILQ